MRKTKGISFDTEKEQHLIEHLEKQPNQSRYLLDLIKKDMEQQNTIDEEYIKKIVLKYVKEYCGDSPQKNEISSKSINKIFDL